MLNKVDFKAAKMTREEYKPLKDSLVKQLVVLQQQAHQRGIGVVVLVDGPSGAGRGTLISDIICRLDARFASIVIPPVYNPIESAKLAEAGGCDGMEPFMAPFWRGLRARGEMSFYDQGGWYGFFASKFIKEYNPRTILEKYNTGELDVAHYIRSMRHFEKQLHDDGYIVLKFFLNITKEEQKKRLKRLAASPTTSWRVDESDWEGVHYYSKLQQLYDTMLEATNYDFAPWILLNGEDRRRANIRFMQALVIALDEAQHAAPDQEAIAAAEKASANSAGQGEKVSKNERSRSAEENAAIRQANEAIAARQHSFAPKASEYQIEADRPTLIGVDYHLHLPEGTYRTMLKAEQKRFRKLELEMYLQRKSLVLVYEGWDAAGKGSGYRRQVQALDAKAYNIFTSPAPTKPELMHPFLWRYWALRMGRAGHVSIYDRSWYGRVLVERVEGFASPSEWARAYDEINAFEQDLVDWGAIVLKFWLEIDRDEQMRRFEARENTPEKQWKIVDEDWRNRDKYPQYRDAVEDMFRLTSTTHAPWHLIEGNDKEYARIKMLRIINSTLETCLSKKKEGK